MCRLTRYYVARCGWGWLGGGGGWLPVRLPVGLPRPSREPAECTRPAEALATIGDAGGQAEIAVAQRPEGIRAGAGSAVSGRAHLLPPDRDPVRRLQPDRTATLAASARPCTLIRSPGAKIAGWPRIDRGALTVICPLRLDITPAELAAAMRRPSPGEVPRRSGHPVLVLLGSSAAGFAARRLREGRT